jgi:hypothetical protein
MPDYFFSTTGANVTINPSFAWDHGYYSPNIDVTWAALAGPGVGVHGVDGPGPADGNESHDPNSTNTVPQASTVGTWVEETDLRPTLLHLAGLQDDYPSDGQVISQALAHPNGALAQVTELGALYRQLNSSVGAFATDTLFADSAALASGSAADDSAYQMEQESLAHLANARDKLAAEMKMTLAQAAQGAVPSHGTVSSELARARALLTQAHELASGG